MRNSILQKFKQRVSIVALDIGGRGGPDFSLAPISEIVSWTLFEPDLEECERLKSLETTNWKNINVIGVGIGQGKKRKLNLYRQRGCSSLLEANYAIAQRFAREEYYILDDVMEVSMMGLDEALNDHKVTDASYLKIDIQGAEIEAFQSGTELLSQLVMLRTEVSFLPVYKDQPLFSEVEQFLRRFDFELFKFVETHHWRRGSKVKYPSIDRERKFASSGQLIHGDALFIKSPETIARSNDPSKKLLHLALLAFAYGEVDLSADALIRLEVQSQLQNLNCSAEEIIEWMTGEELKRARKAGWKHRMKDLIDFLLARRV